jgi:rubrerythrin
MGMKPGLTIGKIFDKAIKIEETAGRIYKRFAELFSDFPKIASFWEEMNKDELNHAKWLSEVKKALSEEQLLSRPNHELILKSENVLFLLKRNSAKGIHNLDEAYEVTRRIESSEMNYLFELLGDKFVSLEDKKNSLISKINEHQKKITDFPEKFGDKTARKRIKAEGR